MRHLFLLAGLLLAGCVTPEEQAAYLAATYGPQCTARRLPAGSPAYQQCVQDLDLRQRQNYQIMQQNNYNALQQQHCFRNNHMLQCD
jgi:hypothetical protein